MSSQVHVEITTPLATVRLDGTRDDRLLDRDGWQALGDAFDELSRRSDVACVVVCGTGDRPLSTGSSTGSRTGPGQEAALREDIARAVLAVRTCAHPTVAVIEGICRGGGLEVAASCDVRVCGESSRFGAPIQGSAYVGSREEVGPIVHLLGASPVVETLWSGELIDAERASTVGLVNRIYADASVQPQGYGLAARIAAGAPLVNRWHKQLMRRLREQPRPGDAEPDGAGPFEAEAHREGPGPAGEPSERRFKVN